MAMDRLEGEAYIDFMFSRIVTILAMLTIAVVTMATSTHAARMSAGSSDAVHAVEMAKSHGKSGLRCGESQTCGSAEAGICVFVCAGLSVFQILPSGDAGRDVRPDSHDLPSGAILASREPRLSERPPKLHLT